MTNQEGNKQTIPLNLPQLLYSLIQPNIGVNIWGRFTGKTEGPGADFTLKNIYAMPRSNGFIQGTTYAKIITTTLPGLIAGWERLGFKKDLHFWDRTKPPENLRIKPALREPGSYQHFLKVHNGTGIYLISQDRASTIHGVRTQWGFIDEAKLINKKKFDEETIPTMAGGSHLWGEHSSNHLSNYLSLLFCSDMPTDSGSKWLLDFEELVDKKKIQLILSAQYEITLLLQEFPNASKARQLNIKRKLSEYQEYINKKRLHLVYFSLASAIENIHSVGLEPIKNAKRVLTDIQFRVSILNERLLKNENGFYALLDPKIHGYDDQINYEHFDKLDQSKGAELVRDCRWDADIDTGLPLEIVFDHNSAINCVITNQDHGHELRELSSKFVLHPYLLDSCVKLWHNYYKYHPVKDIYYWYDSTSVKGDARTDISFADEIVNALTKLGWNVIRMDIGQIGSHHSRYHMWGTLLNGKDPRLPKFTYNKENCKDWEMSAQQAGVIKIGHKVQKDKRPEREKSGVKPQEATHLSEAQDIFITGKIRSRFNFTRESVGMIRM